MSCDTFSIPHGKGLKIGQRHFGIIRPRAVGRFEMLDRTGRIILKQSQLPLNAMGLVGIWVFLQ